MTLTEASVTPAAPTAAGALVPTRSVPATGRIGHRSKRVRLLVVALVLGLLAPLVSVAAPADARSSLPRRTATEVKIDWAVRWVLNAERLRNGLPPLHMNSRLRVSARRHNVTMARFNTMAHELPGEANFARRMTLAGYHWSWAGENIAWNSAMTKQGVLVLQNLMYNERAPYDGHRQNILNPEYKDVGVDVYMDRKHHKVWLTTDFGRG